MTSIVAAEDRYPLTPGAASAAEAVVVRHWRHGFAAGHQAGQPKGPLPDATHPSVVAYARVDHGRWIVDCPHPGCASAQLASRDDHRLFCVDCDAGGTGVWVPVVWPADSAGIEATLDARPDAAHRHWTLGETLDALRGETAAHTEI